LTHEHARACPVAGWGVLRRALLLGVPLCLLAAPAPASANTALFRGVIRYEDSTCGKDGQSTLRPAGARIFAERDGDTDSDRLDGAGVYKLLLDGNGPAKAWLELRSGDVEVGPKLAPGPYRIPLGHITPGPLNKHRLKGAMAGAANIFAVLQEGAQAARDMSPKPIPAVRAAWRYGHDLTQEVEIDAADHTAYRPNKDLIIVDAQHQWDPATLLHEYGHHFEDEVAKIGNPGGRHRANETFPNKPELPLSEGFGDAFAAMVIGPDVNIHCRPGSFRLDGAPATYSGMSRLDRPRFAQYNEVRVAGTMYHLAQYLGDRKGKPITAGFRELVFAMRQYSAVGGHATHNMREFRDALISRGLQSDDPHAQQAEIDSIFAAQEIGWGMEVDVRFDDRRSEGSQAWIENHLVLNGPYGRCEFTGDDGSISDIEPTGEEVQGGDILWHGTIGPFGALPYTWQDDCMVTGGDGNVSPDSFASIQNSILWLDFPYLKGGRHLDGEFSLTGRYACAPDHPEEQGPESRAAYECTGDRSVRVEVRHGPIVDEVTSMKLGSGATPILKFEAGGKCEFADGKDCGV